MHQGLDMARHQSPDLFHDDASLPDGCSSPRTKIARKLGALDLEHTHRDWTHSPRKRTRLSSEELPVSSEDEGDRIQNNQHLDGQESTGLARSDTSTESNGTSIAAASPRQQSRLTHFLQSTKPKRLRSPPCPKSTDEDDPDQLAAGQTMLSTTTWRDSEITGMTIDFAAGDDGEGINGIAFRPSAQLAYERRQRRKQQVSSWKAREAREARVRRLERRNGCKVENRSEREREKHRTVRFVDPGS